MLTVQEKQEILQNVYNKLRFTDAVSSKEDFAKKVGYNYTSTSGAFNGVERYLNKSFFSKVLRAFPQISSDYMLTGKGSILLADGDKETGEIDTTHTKPRENGYHLSVDMSKVLDALTQQQELTRRQQEQTDRALGQIDKLIEIIQSMSPAKENN